MGAALRPRIADQGWASFSGAVERGGRVQRLSQTSHSAGGRGRWPGGRERSQPLTSVIRLSRVGKKIAGSVLVMAEDEKTRRLNKKTCVAHALCLIGYVPWITPQELLPAWKTHTHTHTCIRHINTLTLIQRFSVNVRSPPVARAC